MRRSLGTSEGFRGAGVYAALRRVVCRLDASLDPEGREGFGGLG